MGNHNKSAAVSFRNCSFAYPGQELVVEDVSFELADNRFLAIIGPNGGGKSTVIKLILGLLKPSKGDVSVLGQSPEKARRRVGYVPQNTSHNLEFPIRVRDVVLSGRVRRGLWRYTSEDRDAATEALDRVGMGDLGERRIGELSGGQRQRVLVARALVGNPDLLLLDEPTAAMDGPAQEVVYELLKDLNKQCPIIVVSHDVSMVSRRVDSIACMNRCMHFHEGTQITRETLEATWGHPVDCLVHDIPHRHLEGHDCQHHHHD